MIMALNATCTNISDISRQSILLVEEAGGPGENHQQTLTNFITYCCTPRPERESNPQHQ